MFAMRVGVLLLLCLFGASNEYQAQAPKPTASASADPALILAEARDLYRKGSFDQALARYNEILKSDPQSGDAYAGIIRCYLKQDKVHEADDALQKGLQANPANLDLKVAEGELLFRQGEIPEAGKLFDEVIATPPDPAQPNAPLNARAYFGSARVAAASAMYAREHIFITRAHSLDSSDPEIRKLWMQTLSSGDRIHSLEDYLAQPNNDDEDTRHRLRERLDFLKASQSARSASCRLASDVTNTRTTMVPLALSSGFQANGLAVTINGKASRLLLDTGASGILISSKLASQAGLKSISDLRIGGVGDKLDSPAHLAYADSVKIGEMEFRNCPLYVVDRMPSTEDGIIGTDVFANFLIELDFPSSSVILSQLPPREGEAPTKGSLNTIRDESASEPEAKPSSEASTSSLSSRYEDRYVAPEMHSYVQAYRLGHYFLIPTKINENSDKLFLLDTGAFDNTITPAAAEEVTKIHRAPKADVRGMNGGVKKVYVAERVTLDFGHLRQTVPNIVSIDMSRVSRAAGTEISGTLGMVMLQMLTIRMDYRDALVDFRYTQKPPRGRH